MIVRLICRYELLVYGVAKDDEMARTKTPQVVVNNGDVLLEGSQIYKLFIYDTISY